MLVPPFGGQWVDFGTIRADPDFTDDELGPRRSLQPGLVALYTALTLAEHVNPQGKR